MAKRITENRLLKWMNEKKTIGIPIGIAIVLFMFYLGSIEVLDFTGDIYHNGSARINITFEAKEDIFIYPMNASYSLLEFDNPEAIKLVKMYRTWGKGLRELDLSKKCTGSWCGCGWCTKSNTAEFVYAFRKGREYTIVYDLELDPKADVKWSFLGDLVDPYIIGKKITDDVFKELKYSEEGVAEFEMYSPSKLSKSSLNLSFNEVYGSVRDYKILVLKDLTKSVNDYSTKEECYFEVSNQTKVCNNVTYVSGTHLVKYQEWVEVIDIPYGTEKYRIEADIQPQFKDCPNNAKMCYSIDWIPELITPNERFKQGKWAWFNVSLGSRRSINCTNMDDGVPLVINGSDGFDIDGETQIVWTACQGSTTALYYNNYTDYIVANDSAQLPFEVESGNGTSYNPTTVWGDADRVYHFDGDCVDTMGDVNCFITGSGTYAGSLIGNAYQNPSSGIDQYIDFGSTDTVEILPDINTTWMFSFRWLDTPVFNMQMPTHYDGSYPAVWHHNTATGFWYRVYKDGSTGYNIRVTPTDWYNTTKVWWIGLTTLDNGTSRIYVNGEFMNSTDLATSTNIGDTNCRLTVGGDWYNNREADPFIFDEFRIYQNIGSEQHDLDFFNQTYQNVIGTSGFGNLVTREAYVGSPVDLYLEGYTRNITVELGSLINISANTTDNSTVCIDINHLAYGTNYSCTENKTEFDLNITWFRTTTFNDSTTSKTITGSYSPLTNTTYFQQHDYDTISSATIDLIGYSKNVTQEDYNSVSYNYGTGDVFTNPTRCYDGDWTTHGYVDSPGSIYTAEVFEDYEMPNNISGARSTSKFYYYSDCNAVTTTNSFIQSCWNSSNEWETIRSRSNTGTGSYGPSTLTYDVPNSCLTSYDQELKIKTYIFARDACGGKTVSTRYYEQSIQWEDTYPQAVSLKLNDTTKHNFPGELVNNISTTYRFTDNDFNETFYTAGTMIKYITLDTFTNVTSASINITGYGYYGGKIDTFEIKGINYPRGIYVNASGNRYWSLGMSTQVASSGTSCRWKTYNLDTHEDTFNLYNSYCSGTDGGIAKLGGIIRYGDDAWGANTFYYSNLEHQTGVTYDLNLDRVSGDSENAYDTSIGYAYTPGDLGYFNSSLGLIISCANYGSNCNKYFYTFELGAIGTWSNAIPLTGNTGYDYIEGIDGADDDTNVYIITTSGVTIENTPYVLEKFDIDGTFQNSEFRLEDYSGTIHAMSYDNGRWYVLGDDGNVRVYTNETLYPENLIVDMGIDGIIEYQGTTNLTGEIKVDLNVTAINKYLSNTCSQTTTPCTIPILFGSESPGTIIFTEINIQQPINDIDLNTFDIELFVEGDTTITNIPINTTFSWGILGIEDLKIDYKGGNKTYEVKAHNPTYTLNDTYTITYYHSGWDYSYPSGIKYLDFFPTSSTDTNVEPFGQTSTIPIFNITPEVYGNDEIDFYIILNETHDCVNISFSNTNTKGDGTVINATDWYKIKGNTDITDSFGFWMWNDYDCSSQGWTTWFPNIHFRACASGVDVCVEALT